MNHKISFFPNHDQTTSYSVQVLTFSKAKRMYFYPGHHIPWSREPSTDFIHVIPLNNLTRKIFWPKMFCNAFNKFNESTFWNFEKKLNLGKFIDLKTLEIIDPQNFMFAKRKKGSSLKVTNSWFPKLKKNPC